MSMFKTIDAIDDMDYDSYPIDIAKFASTIIWCQPADYTINHSILSRQLISIMSFQIF